MVIYGKFKVFGKCWEVQRILRQNFVFRFSMAFSNHGVITIPTRTFCWWSTPEESGRCRDGHCSLWSYPGSTCTNLSNQLGEIWELILILLNLFFSVNKNCGGFSYHLRINLLDATFEEQNDSRDESMKLIRLMRSRLEISGRWDEDALKEKVHIVWLYWSGWEYPRILCFFLLFSI